MRHLIKSGRTFFPLLTFTVAAVALGVMLLLVLASAPATRAATIPCAPILIDGDSSFTPANGVNGGGSGTQANPYIIENWAIDASSSWHGIRIQNTTKYFIIRNCLVENGGWAYHGLYLGFGIWLNNVVNGRIENNICGNNEEGISLNDSSNNTLSNNTCSNNSHCGIGLSSSSNNTLSNNTCSNSEYGIVLSSSSNNTLSNNTCWNNRLGIELFSSSNNTLSNNTCENNRLGFYLFLSSNNAFSNNTCSNNDHNFSVEGSDISHFGHDIDTSNLVDGRPIYYLKDNSNIVIGPSLNPGYLALVRCDNIRVENLVLENNGQGILLASTENSLIENCKCLNNHYGIYLFSSSNNTLSNNICKNSRTSIDLRESSNNTLSNNTCENNTEDGILLESSSNNTLSNNTCENSGRYGIRLYYESSNNTLSNNICENNGTGIDLYESSNNNTLSNNTCSNNSWGISLRRSPNNTLRNNTLSHNRFNFIVKEYDISHFDHDIDTSNLINGRPIYYLKDKVDMVIGPSLNPGYLALVRCDNIRVENLVLENNGQGILLASTENSLIENCTFSNNSDYGILLCYSSNNNTIENNTCENNNIGTGLWSSSNNTIFHNYLLNNAEINAYDYSGTNYWDENGEGNYWGDWQPPEHPDSDNDGIVDEPRPIAGGTNQDGYPLVVGFGGVTSPTTTPAPAETTWIWAAFGIGAVIVIAIVALVLTHRK